MVAIVYGVSAHWHAPTFLIEHDVLGLEITVNDTKSVKVFDGDDELRCVEAVDSVVKPRHEVGSTRAC